MAHTIVIFGASGDLTSRKLVPALYELHRKERLPHQTRIVGFSRTRLTDEAWREKLARSTAHFLGDKFQTALWETFAGSLFYYSGSVQETKDVASLKEYLDTLEGKSGATRVYYLSLEPHLFEPAICQLGAAGMAKENGGQRRIVIEKPFGADLVTARHLNDVVHDVFPESHVFRIDDYLGKETVQNLLVFRFANSIFEPIWNRNYIDHVQITVAEEGTVGHRAAYYDSVGALRDLFQAHLLQLLALTAMEPPVRFEADAVRDEKVKVLRAIRPMRPENVAVDTLRGQYRRYRDEPGVASNSQTATFGIVKLFVDNWRWQDIPFYLRSGKAMSCHTAQVVIQFRQAPHMMFEDGPRAPNDANRLVMQMHPAEGIQLHFQTKVPDAGMKVRLTDLNFTFQDRFAEGMPEAYQRLLLNAMHGDASLFSRADEVELAWSIIDRIQTVWDRSNGSPVMLYESGGWGPPQASDWMQSQGREWFDTCPVLK